VGREAGSVTRAGDKRHTPAAPRRPPTAAATFCTAFSGLSAFFFFFLDLTRHYALGLFSEDDEFARADVSIAVA
jgi:hypothetical protein